MSKKPSVKQFRKIIWKNHEKNRRDLPWRRTHRPYQILVSEVMLQQTQVSRVLIKYKSFLKKFPTTKILADAPLRDVLIEWQGLGYNRRAMYLKKTAEEITNKYKGVFPKSFDELIKLPGIGQSTAGALLAFSYGAPAVFIETNIRSVFIHFFFKDDSSVSETMIREMVEKTLDHSNPREWYYALYDYGAMLKKSTDHGIRSTHRKSSQYRKQSKFIGSNREIRSEMIKLLLLSKKSLTSLKISQKLNVEIGKIEKNLQSMQKEGLIVFESKGWKTA